MITVAGRQLNTSVLEVIQTLRQYMLDLGEDYFHDIKDAGNDIMLTCPRHSNHNERKPSCGVRKTDGFCHCFTCGYAVPFEEMISNVMGYDDGGIKGIQWLFTNFIETIYNIRNDIEIPVRNEISRSNTYITDDVLYKYRYYHKYMWKRGLTEDIVDKFDIGYNKENNTITFPVNDIKGNCVFVAERSVIGKFFHYPKSSEKPVYALDKIVKNNIKEVYVVESFFNCLTLWKWGRPAIALMGASLTDYQKKQLEKTDIKRFILCFDGDSAGRKGAKRFEELMPNKLIKVIDMYEGKDVNDLTLEQFEKLEKKYL